MSTILDALSRAERERQMGMAPPIAEAIRTAAPDPVRRVRLRPWILLVFLSAVVLAGLAAVLWPRPPALPERLAPPKTVLHAPTQSSTPDPVPPASAPLKPGRRVESSPPSHTGIHANAAPQPSGHAGAPGRTNATGHPAPASLASAHPAPVAKHEEKAPGVKQGEVTKWPNGNEERKPAAAVAAPAPAASAEILPRREELPDGLRQQLPQLAVSGYIYAVSPKDRSIILNGRLLHEGEEVAPGLRLEQMRADGVVLEFKGQRFRMAY